MALNLENIATQVQKFKTADLNIAKTFQPDFIIYLLDIHQITLVYKIDMKSNLKIRAHRYSIKISKVMSLLYQQTL